MLITSPCRIGPYDLEGLPNVPRTSSVSSTEGEWEREQNLLDIDDLQVLLDLLWHIFDIFPVVRR
jgi:hypothetical protein